MSEQETKIKKRWSFGRVLAAVLSVLAGGGAIFCAFQEWLTVDLLGTWQASLTLLGLRSAVTQAQEELSELSSSLSELGLNNLFSIDDNIAAMKRFALIVLACLAGVILLEVIYLVILLCNRKASRFFGILAGLAVLGLTVAFMVLVYRENAALLEQVKSVNEALNSLTGADSLLGTLQEFFTGTSGGLDLSLPETDILKFTIYPVVTAVLGLVEVITAR